MSKIRTRMGDGYVAELTPEEVRGDLEAGCADAVKRGKVPPLEENEIDWLFDLFACPSRIMGVEPGHEVILTKDGSVNTLYSAQLSSGVGLPLAREQCFRIFERAFCFDTMEIGHPDYSYKPVKPIVALEATGVEQALLTAIIPVFYGAMPNFGLYAQPDGPFPNPADLLPRGEVEAAREAQMHDGRGVQGRHALRLADDGAGGQRRHQLRHHRLHRRRRVPRRARDGGGAGRHHRPRHRGGHGG